MQEQSKSKMFYNIVRELKRNLEVENIFAVETMHHTFFIKDVIFKFFIYLSCTFIIYS